MVTIGARLREERERLGMNQDGFAAAGGVGKRALIHYEKNERSPDATFLAAVSAVGADVLYILTGQRQGGLPPMSMSQLQGEILAPDEKAVLENYRHAPDGVKVGVKTTLETFAPGVGAKRGKRAA